MYGFTAIVLFDSACRLPRLKVISWIYPILTMYYKHCLVF